MEPDNWRQELEAALKIIEDLLRQACGWQEGDMADSAFLSAYAEGLEFLARHGRFFVQERCGRWVRGRFTRGTPLSM